MKKPLLLLHGAIHSSAQFDSLKENLQNNFEIYTPDLPGHGKNISTSGITMQGMADFISDYITAHQIKSCMCFGYSMGGYVALTAELQNPGLFSSIFTLATKFNWTPETAVKEASMINADLLQEKVPAFVQYLKQTHGDNWIHLSKQLSEMLKDLGANPPLNAETAKQISVPVRISVGDKDRMVSIEESVPIYRGLPNATFQVFPNTQHPLDRVNAEMLLRELKMFFGQDAARA